MAANLTTLTHKIAIQLHLVAESCTICNSRSRQPVRKLLVILSYFDSPPPPSVLLAVLMRQLLLRGSSAGLHTLCSQVTQFNVIGFLFFVLWGYPHQPLTL
jgi:hypothetical protein